MPSGAGETFGDREVPTSLRAAKVSFLVMSLPNKTKPPGARDSGGAKIHANAKLF
jgi:hypothetical protein